MVCRERVGYGRDMRRAGRCVSLSYILPLRPVALNGETKERDEMESERISLSGHLMGI
jgi:hypothetical protein